MCACVFRQDAGSSMDPLDLESIFEPDRRAQGAEPAIPSPQQLPADWYERWQERAAIMQYGKLPPERADAEALQDVLRQMAVDKRGT